MRDKTGEFLRGKPTSGNREQLLAALNKLVFFFLVFMGLWISTQYAARLARFDPVYVGDPWTFVFKNPVYAPWGLFEWIIRYRAQEPLWPWLRQSMVPWLAVSLFAVVVYTVLTYFRGFRQKAENVMGTARWATREDLKKEGLLTGRPGIMIGMCAEAEVEAVLDFTSGAVSLHLHKPSDFISMVGIANVLLAGQTRKGKGVSTIIPTLLSYPNSVVVLDFKGEAFDQTSKFRETFSDVYRWSPLGEDGHSFNGLMEVRGGKDSYGDTNLIADVLCTPAGGKGKSDENSEYFREAGMDFLTGAALHVLCSDYADKSLPGLRDFLSSSNPKNPSDDTYIYKAMLGARHANEEVHNRVLNAASNQLKRPDKERGSVLSTALKSLRIFEDTRVRENTKAHDFSFAEFEHATRPIALYITIPYGHIERITPLIRLFILFMLRKFSEGETQHGKRKMKIPLLMVLDEVDKLGKIPELQNAMGILNGFGVHFLLAIQSPSQIIDLYGQNNQFFAHCQNIILYAMNEYSGAELCSKMVGKDSVWKTNTGTSGSRFSVGLDNINLSGSEIARDLINPDEVMKLGHDRFILLTNGRPPYIGKKNVFYEDKRLKNRVMGPAFTTYAQAKARIARKKTLTETPWYALPLHTCLEYYEDIVIDPHLIDPRLNPYGAAEYAASQQAHDIDTASEPEPVLRNANVLGL